MALINFKHSTISKSAFILAAALLISSSASFSQTAVKNTTVVENRKPVPDFKIASIDDNSIVYSPSQLKGKVYLIDFWATWCGPCVKALPHLQKLYDQYKDKSFTIVSLSMDQSEQTVSAFRKKRGIMPWFNGFIKGGFENPIAKSFDVSGLPSAVLVDREGNIIAKNKQLDGDKLDAILARELGK